LPRRPQAAYLGGMTHARSARAAATARFPDFVGIGAQKAGTTWLHENLLGHPDVWLPPVKELHYFDQLYVDTPGHQRAADERRRRKARRVLGDGDGAAAVIVDGEISDDWYGRIFAAAPSHSICGEITGSYALLPDEGVAHLARLNPDVKILFLLRDPIDRALAHVRMLYRRGDPQAQREFEPLPTIELDPRVLNRSRYSETVRRYREHFADESIWIGDFDQIASDPAALVRSVCAFLGVGFEERLFPRMHRKIHEGTPRELGDEAYERLKRALEPEYEALNDVLPDAARRWRVRHFS
jgi:hypothetical protein